MAKANTGNDAKDAISWFNSNYAAIGMNNDYAGPDTLRHLLVMLMGLGMRELSGQHCEGRDQVASNTSSDTAKPDYFSKVANSLSASHEMQKLYDEYLAGGGLDGSQELCALDIFSEDVSCSVARIGDATAAARVSTFKPCASTVRNSRSRFARVGLRVLKDIGVQLRGKNWSYAPRPTTCSV